MAVRLDPDELGRLTSSKAQRRKWVSLRCVFPQGLKRLRKESGFES
jgi:hypothetical protein